MRVLIIVGWIASLVVLDPSPAMADTTKSPRILSEDRFALRRIVSIEIPGRLDKAKLSRLAKTIKNRDRNAYDRTIINFYLPRVMLGAGSWATAVFSPDLELTINGLRLEEAQQFTKDAKIDRRDVIGSWLTASPATLGKLTIYRDDDRKFAEWTLRNGFKNVNEVVESHTWSGRRFDIKPHTEAYFLINHAGQLELRDNRGLVATAERVWPINRKAATPYPQAVLQWPVGRTAAEAVAHRDAPDKLFDKVVDNTPVRSPSQGRYDGHPIQRSADDQPSSELDKQASAVAPNLGKHAHKTDEAITSADHLMAQLVP